MISFRCCVHLVRQKQGESDNEKIAFGTTAVLMASGCSSSGAKLISGLDMTPETSAELSISGAVTGQK